MAARQIDRKIERIGGKMILKYKSGNNAWVYKHVGDITIGKADISEVISKYIDKDTGKININKDNLGKQL